MQQVCVLPIGSDGNMVVKSRLPTCILPEYWKRHQLTRRDIDIIVSYIPTKIIWMCAVAHGITCPWFTLRSSSAPTLDVTLSGKAIAIEMLIEHSGIPMYNINQLDIDSLESFEHVPPIPKHKISGKDYELVTSGIASQLIPRVLLQPGETVGTIPLIYQYKGLDWIPVGIEGDALCCNAIIKESLYVYKEGPRRGVTHDPKIGIYKSIIYCLTDELLLLYT